MGRPGAPIYPAEPAGGERDCLNCDEPFTPAATGWQALYCSHACWRANNGGPRRQPPAPPADPVPEILDQVATKGPLDGGIVWPPPQPEPAPPAASRLIVVGREDCPQCGTPHEVYGLATPPQEVRDAPR